MTKSEVAPEGTKDHDPAPPCPDCGAPRYWSDYWTDEFIAICVSCASKHVAPIKKTAEGVEPFVRYWARAPGKFVNKDTGEEIKSDVFPLTFRGTVREWYETLAETIHESLKDHCSRCEGISIFVTGPLLSILETTIAYRPNLSASHTDNCPVLVGSLYNSIAVYNSHMAAHDWVTICSPEAHIGTIKVDMKSL